MEKSQEYDLVMKDQCGKNSNSIVETDRIEKGHLYEPGVFKFTTAVALSRDGHNIGTSVLTWEEEGKIHVVWAENINNTSYLELAKIEGIRKALINEKKKNGTN